MKHKQGILVVLSGPSGAGKSTVISKFINMRDDTKFSVSVTTRMPRPGEANGKDYRYCTKERFLELIDQKFFLEYTKYAGEYYGTPKENIDACISSGFNVLLDVEVNGASQVLAAQPDAVSIFLCPPSFQELERRLRARKTETEPLILKRLARAKEEYKYARMYSYVVINDSVEIASQELNAIVTAENCRFSKVSQYLDYPI